MSIQQQKFDQYIWAMHDMYKYMITKTEGQYGIDWDPRLISEESKVWASLVVKNEKYKVISFFHAYNGTLYLIWYHLFHCQMIVVQSKSILLKKKINRSVSYHLFKYSKIILLDNFVQILVTWPILDPKDSYILDLVLIT